jgi:hypothetical protein
MTTSTERLERAVVEGLRSGSLDNLRSATVALARECPSSTQLVDMTQPLFLQDPAALDETIALLRGAAGAGGPDEAAIGVSIATILLLTHRHLTLAESREGRERIQRYFDLGPHWSPSPATDAMIDVACEAAASAQRAADAPELRATALKLEGVCAARRHREESAVAIFERALPDLEVDEKTEVLLMLGEIDAQRGDDDSARRRYQTAIENDRFGAERGGHFTVRAHCELARSYLGRRDLRMVLEHLAAAIAVPECCHGVAREEIARIAASARDAAAGDMPMSVERLEQISGISRCDWGSRAPGLLAIFEPMSVAIVRR